MIKFLKEVWEAFGTGPFDHIYEKKARIKEEMKHKDALRAIEKQIEKDYYTGRVKLEKYTSDELFDFYRDGLSFTSGFLHDIKNELDKRRRKGEGK